MKIGDLVKAQYPDSGFEQGETGKISGVYEKDGSTQIEVEFDLKGPERTTRCVIGPERWIKQKFRKVLGTV